MTTKINNILEKNNVTVKDIIDYYSGHSLAQTSQNFNISQFVIDRVLEDNGVCKHTRKENTEFTNIERYGCKNVSQSDLVKNHTKENNLIKYGVESVWQREDVKKSIKQTMLDRYGVEHSSQVPGSRVKTKETVLKNFGKDNYNNRERFKKTMLERYGKEVPLQVKQFKDKSIDSCLEKYGVPYNCMRDEARMHGNDSKPNQEFAFLLDSAGFKKSELSMDNEHYSREFTLDSFSYDFKVGSILIEVNPTITHNALFVPFNRDPLDKNYHKDKSLLALKNNYRCIHVFDWEDKSKIINLLQRDDKVYGRLCTIKEVDIDAASDFINRYHVQNYAKDLIRLGLFYKDELISVMTFGKPRYNKNYEYEIVRYCSSTNVIGGAEKMFKYFLREYSPQSIISYCDLSKFDGSTYDKLGFKLISSSIKPSKHWYNQKTNKHITDNLLRQRGFDQLFGTDFGKMANNDDLMVEHGFLPIYDCGQASYVWFTKTI